MIYFDNNATTQIAPEVFDRMKPYLTEFYGNPSSAYNFGRDVRTAIETAREKVAELLGAPDASEIVFTSGGTESNNWAVFGTLEANPSKKHLVTTGVEHEAVRRVCEKLQKHGFEITWLGVSEEGFLDLQELKNSLREDTAIVSVMLANNETGILFPVADVARIVKENSDAVFHVDGVNAVGKIPVNLKETEIDLFSISGHKFHAPKGIGALYVRSGVNLPSLSIGGGQESGRRAGTEAAHQIVALGAAADLVKDFSAMRQVVALRDKLENEILDKIPNSHLNGTRDSKFRLPNTANISFENINGETILAKLNDAGVCVSTGSACNSDAHIASPVLQAMNVPYSQAMGAIRFSLGRYNTEAEVNFVLEVLPKIVKELKEMSL
ncbi:MAG: Cysteine desulfurase [uncultured Pyrinomonadaceae bacterium]|uniref:cysteine desulfurase n=1 Tax=uncultured Pyrinomonadaceae bacterium TaxID=2283094 RepID=A0A6J4PDB4_9BACT|nr:MAG: Cysteine desulfurase [uncultured Pyrinomonadaceae bacterium]